MVREEFNDLGKDMEEFAVQQDEYPVRFAVDYPDRPLDRLSTAFRMIVAIPILIVAASVGGEVFQSGERATVATAGGFLFLGPLLMILFRQKYPRWWFDWNPTRKIHQPRRRLPRAHG